jgi:hypothetical protein
LRRSAASSRALGRAQQLAAEYIPQKIAAAPLK